MRKLYLVLFAENQGINELPWKMNYWCIKTNSARVVSTFELYEPLVLRYEK